jgi:hypothetical protein
LSVGNEVVFYSSSAFRLFISFSLGQIFAAEFALRAVDAKRFSGVAIGLALAALLLPTWYFPVGLFGLYCFLNAKFQNSRFEKAPQCFLNILGAMNLNQIKITQQNQD